jgi:hypothetical protein
MADSKITALTALTAADPANDMIPIVDVSDTPPASGNTKRISINNLLACSPSATLASATITGDLTVRTNKLAVTSTGVGVGTASPNSPFHVDGTWYVNSALTLPALSASLVTGEIHAGAGNSLASDSGFLRLSAGGGTTLGVKTALDIYRDSGGSAAGLIAYVAGSPAMTLNSTGLGVGVTPSAGRGAIQLSAGVAFPATQVASSDANTLDDYVESTFSPTIVGSTTAGSATYSTQVGRYTKIGRLVTFSLRVAYTGGTGTGNLRVGGLPTAGFGSNFAIYAENIALTASYYPVASISASSAQIGIDQLPIGGGAASAVAYDVAGDIQISGSYIV